MSKLFYRFRKTQNIFDFKELENQEIYFASNEELNDPMEGFKNLVFNGDKIVWRNLFKHYLLCFEFMYQTYLICGESHAKFEIDLIPIFRNSDDIETLKYKELFKKIYLETFEIYGQIIDKIATRTTPILKEELFKYLYPFHMIALEIIQRNYESEGLIPKRENPLDIQNFIEQDNIKLIDVVEAMIQEHGQEKMDKFLRATSFFYEEFNFVQSINLKHTPNKLFLLNFPQNYLRAIEKLTYPKNYVACFTGEKAINNSSVWGHYGDNHKGICLMFKPNEKESLPFSNAKIGYGRNGVILGKISLSFDKIIYGEAYPEIDFFRSLGRLPIPKLNATWYKDDDKKLSDIHSEVFTDEEKWRNGYWNKYSQNNLIKTKDWAYEDEYRLVLNSGMDGEIDKKYRILKYDFQNMQGLIFGINTTNEDKIKIFEIIQKKCAEYKRKDFEFYQAYYCNTNKNIQFKKFRIGIGGN